jgi:hypothetical protein
MRLHAPASLHTARRHLAAAVALACVAGAALAAPADGEPAAQPVKELHYGDTLFNFYQQKYFSSLTGLMVSQHFGRMPKHADEAEILRGGLLLSYGLHREAGAVFAQLIERGAPPAVRDRAWFYLAKIRYQRGFLAEAEDAVGRIAATLPAELEEERVLLQAQLLMARADYSGASRTLAGLSGKEHGKDSAMLYARYNLGVALVRNGDTPGGSAFLDDVGKAPAATEDLRSLRDQANVALGFAAMQAGRPEGARGYLERVRLNGPHSNKALLGFGWAAAEMKQPKSALVPWTELAGRDGNDAAVLEGRIALPYALAELGALGQALARYNDAIAAFEREGTALDESIAAIRAGKLVDGLLEQNPGEGMGWFWNIGQLPQMPHGAHLGPVLAQHEFQEAFKNVRDLHFLARNLKDWDSNLGVYGDMLANRRQGYAERLPALRAKAQDTGLPALQKKRDALAAELQTAQTKADGVAFADDRQRDLLQRLEQARATLERAGADPALAGAADRVRLAAGVLAWNLAQEQPARLWSAQKALKATDAGLAEARTRDEAIARAQQDEPARHEAFAKRIAELGTRIRALAPQVQALGVEQQKALQDIAVAELERQKERLAAYTAQARFAVAQLHDRAKVAKVDNVEKLAKAADTGATDAPAR